MQKIIVTLVIFLLISTIGNSGCIDNSKANNTWGEKKISMDSIKVSNNTIGNRSEQNDSVYYVRGYITNQNSFEALDVKIEVITYYSNGTVFALNNSPYLDPKNIPAQSKSYIYARFSDPDKKIATYDVKILSAKGEF